MRRPEGDGKPVLVGGMRGVMERNTMRYFLEAWFDAVERYPRQLHEASLEEYLAMKHRELRASRAPRTASSWP